VEEVEEKKGVKPCRRCRSPSNRFFTDSEVLCRAVLPIAPITLSSTGVLSFFGKYSLAGMTVAWGLCEVNDYGERRGGEGKTLG
jgi:hypothetical protein